MNPHGTTIRYDARGDVVEVTLHYSELVERNGRASVETAELSQRMDGDPAAVEEVVRVAKLIHEGDSQTREALDRAIGSRDPRVRIRP